VSRIDSADIATQLADIRLALDELKNAQRLGGASIPLFVTEMPGFDGPFFPISAGGYGSTSFTFTPDNQDYAYSEIIIRVFVDGTAPANEVFPGDALYPAKLNIERDRPAPLLPTIDYWVVGVRNGTGSSHTYYFKVYVQSTDTGTIT
jgi:hypothetical protein